MLYLITLSSAFSSMPVAITVTITASCILSSTIVPKMMFASGSKNSFIYPTAVLTSLSPKSIPPVTFTISPFAPFTDVSCRIYQF